MKILGKNYYEILEVEITASTEVIKSAYKKKLVEFHPDKHGQDQLALALTQDLAEIISTLTNPIKKYDYDQSLNKGQIREKVVIVEKEPLSRCIICKNPLDASWKTYCVTHYKKYGKKSKETTSDYDFEDEDDFGQCEICGESTNASWKKLCGYHYSQSGRDW